MAKELKYELARITGELMYLRDNEKDYFVRRAYEDKIEAIDVLFRLTPNEQDVLKPKQDESKQDN